MINNIYIALIPLRIYIFHKNPSLQFIYKLANLVIKIFYLFMCIIYTIKCQLYFQKILLFLFCVIQIIHDIWYVFLFFCKKFSVGREFSLSNAKYYTTLFYILVISFHSFKIINCDLEDYNVIQLCFKKIIS